MVSYFIHPRNFRYCVNKLRYIYRNCNFHSLEFTNRITIKNVCVPTAIGFSMFTWLGFDQKPTATTAEDELIKTIKHCVLFIQRSDYERAEQLLHVALKQAQQIQHQLGITYVYDVMGNLALELEQLDKAKKLFVAVSQRLMADGATEDDLRIVHISIKLARISHLKKEHQVAQLGYDWCLDKLRKLLQNNPSDDIRMLIAITEDWYGRLFIDCKQYDNAIKLMISALEHLKDIPNAGQDNIIIQLNDLGAVCDQLGRVDESIAYFNEAISLGKELEDYDLGTFYVNLGRAYLKKNMIVEARKSCGYGLKLGIDNKNKEVENEAQLCLKEVHRAV